MASGGPYTRSTAGMTRADHGRTTSPSGDSESRGTDRPDKTAPSALRTGRATRRVAGSCATPISAITASMASTLASQKGIRTRSSGNLPLVATAGSPQSSGCVLGGRMCMRHSTRPCLRSNAREHGRTGYDRRRVASRSRIIDSGESVAMAIIDALPIMRRRADAHFRGRSSWQTTGALTGVQPEGLNHGEGSRRTATTNPAFPPFEYHSPADDVSPRSTRDRAHENQEGDAVTRTPGQEVFRCSDPFEKPRPNLTGDVA